MKRAWKIVSNKNFFPLLIVVVAAVLASRTLLFQEGYFNMHDDLQMMRQLEMEKCFLDGQIPCRWVPDMGYGFGFPLFNFYPPLPYLIGQVFRVVGYSFVTTVKLNFALSIIASGITMYYLAKEFFGRIGGVLSSIFYVWAPYHAVDVYVRGAMNEAWALVFFPLIFWTSYKLITEKMSSRGDSTTKQSLLAQASQRLPRSLGSLAMTFIGFITNKWVIALTLSYAGLLLSHNLMVLILTPFFGIWVLIHLWQKDGWKRLSHLIFSGIWAFGLASFFTLPALLENKFTQIESVLIGYYDYTAHFVSIRQLLFSRFWGYGPSVWMVADDRMSFQIGHIHWIFSLIIGTFLIIKIFIVIARSKTTKQSLRSLRSARDDISSLLNEFKKESLLAVTGFLLLTGWFTAFLAHPRSIFIWKAFPPLRFTQFPWRFLTIVIFAFSFVIGFLPGMIEEWKKKRGWVAKILVTPHELVWVAILSVGVIAFSWNYFLPENGEMGELTDQEKFTGAAWELQQTAGIYDYLPANAETAPKAPMENLGEFVDDSGDVVEDVGTVTNERQGTDWVEFNVSAKKDVNVRIGIFKFPDWKVWVDGQEVEPFVPEEEEWGRMWIEVPAGEHNVRAEFVNTPIRTTANVTSLAAWTVLITTPLWRKRFSQLQ